MPLRRALLPLFAVLLTVGLLPACKGNCRELSEKLCECEPNTLAKDACNRRVSNEESRISPTEADEQRCEELIERCDCNLINTTEGKELCGLARENPLTP